MNLASDDAVVGTCRPQSAVPTGTPGTRLLANSRAALGTHYCDVLAFEWRRRRRRAESVAFRFDHLKAWDARLASYLRAFRLLGPDGRQSIHERLGDPLSESELFAVAVSAICGRDRMLLRACIAMVQAMPNFSSAFNAALEWTEWEDVEFALALWPREDPLRQSFVLRSIAAHEVAIAPGYAADCAARLAPTPYVQLAALRCGLARGEAGWVANAPALFDATHAELRLAAVEALLVFGSDPERRDALARLRDLALGRGRVAMLATRALMPLQCGPAHQLLEALLGRPDRIRQLIAAMGWSGDLIHLPALVEWLADAAFARPAAAALTELTGSVPAADGWEAMSPVADDGGGVGDEAMPDDVDEGLPWPDAERFAAWWDARAGACPVGPRYLGGQPRSAATLLETLVDGRLSSRPQAAWLVQLSARGRRLGHLAPAFRQQELIDVIEEARGRG